MIKKIISVLILLLTFSTSSNAQELKYFVNIDSAMKFYHDKRYHEAGQAFDQALKEFNGNTTQTNLYNAACAWSLAGNNDKAFLYLQNILNNKMIKSWDDPVDFYNMLIKDTDFEPIKVDPRWTSSLNEAKNKKNTFLNGIKRDIADRIREIGAADQSIRFKLDSVRKVDGLNSTAEKKLILVMKKQDSINFRAFETIIKQYGWLGPTEVGYKNNQYLFLILQHADLDAQKKYLPLFKRGLKDGKVLPKDFAYLEDRINMRVGKMQQYGSQTLIDKLSKKYILYPIADIDNVDERRAKVGLESLKSYMKSSFNIDFDINQYKKELPELKKMYLK
ncbi:DUF6624 domain-containing protein [Pedobacter suwonensis]|nr:DUF6624 domain-containing protein [Pedobacter suwonensis]